MHEVFTGDILTDFPFIEASLGLPRESAPTGIPGIRAGTLLRS
jgi:hypothetical protein